MDHPRDPEALRTGQYRDDANLSARMALHRRFGAEALPWHRWVFDRLPLDPGVRVLEIGCGPGTLWVENADRLPPAVTVVLSDLSEGMLARARSALAAHPARFRFERLDASALPFADGSFDLVVANHMLYHVPDLARTVAEIRRVLVPGGALVAATNGRRHMAELWSLVRAASAEAEAANEPGVDAPPPLAFDLENGAEVLAAAFSDVVLERRSAPLTVTDAAALVAYVASYRPLSGAFRDALRRRAEAAMRASGAMVVGRETGLFIAR